MVVPLIPFLAKKGVEGVFVSDLPFSRQDVVPGCGTLCQVITLGISAIGLDCDAIGCELVRSMYGRVL